MLRFWFGLAALLLIPSCKKGSSTLAQSSAPPAETAGTPAPSDTGASYELTPAKLDRYLVYQQKMLTVTERSLDADRKMRETAQKTDSVVLTTNQLIENMKQTQRDADAARDQAGLSQADVEQLDKMVKAVVFRRTLAAQIDYEKQIKQLEASQKGMTPEQQAATSGMLDVMKKSVADAKSLPEQRAEFGSKNIDTLLTKEAELTKNWEERSKLVIAKGPSGAGK